MRSKSEIKQLIEELNELREQVSQLKPVRNVTTGFDTNYHKLLNSDKYAILVIDMKSGRIIDANTRICEILGYSVKEICNLDLMTLTTDEAHFSQKEALGLLLKITRSESHIFEWHVEKKNGIELWMEVNLKRAMIDGTDQLMAIVLDHRESGRTEEEKVGVQQSTEHEQLIANLVKRFEKKNLIVTHVIGDPKYQDPSPLQGKQFYELPNVIDQKYATPDVIAEDRDRGFIIFGKAETEGTWQTEQAENQIDILSSIAHEVYVIVPNSVINQARLKQHLRHWKNVIYLAPNGKKLRPTEISLGQSGFSPIN